MKNAKPDCSKCQHEETVPGSYHVACANTSASVEGSKYGERSGWFYWPYDFDPTWLISCDGFKQK